MRRIWLVALLLLAVGVRGVEAQSCDACGIKYTPPASTLTAGGSSFFAGGISLGNTVASPYANLYGDAANTLALRNAGTAGTPVPQIFNIYNFCDGAACATGKSFGGFKWTGGQLQVFTDQAGTGAAADIAILPSTGVVYTYTLSPPTADSRDVGQSTAAYKSAYFLRSIQGSKSKALTDNTATAFVRLAVADDDYEGCAIGWTAVAEDANGDARQIRKGRTNVVVLNNSGTEACNFSASADDQAILVTAGTFTCTFDCNSAAADTVDLRATCDTSLDAAAEILTFEYRLDCESTVTVTPQ